MNQGSPINAQIESQLWHEIRSSSKYKNRVGTPYDFIWKYKTWVSKIFVYLVERERREKKTWHCPTYAKLELEKKYNESIPSN